MEKLKVVAAAVDTKELTLYLIDGDTVRIPQGDPRVKKIIEVVTPIVTAGGVAEVDMNMENSYAEFEEKTNGLVKFFKVAKSKLSAFFNKQKAEQSAQAIEAFAVGKIPTAQPASDEMKKSSTEVSTQVEKLNSAVDQIIKNAAPVHSNDVIKDSETVIAVVNNTVVPEVESLKHQITNSLQTGTKGMQRFMERVAAVANKRRHSVEDLMKFMKRGDLPIADDGSIVIYKVLRRGKDGGYVDCHTGKVPQRVGSYVHMDESLVDHDRRNECSNGLHVARRAYVGQFSGDVCVIAKVNPEDVIAVPTYDANKMRVCGYHILFELAPHHFANLRANKPITDTEDGKVLLGRALSGDHPPPIEDVKIRGHMGSLVVVTLRKQQNVVGQVEVRPAEALDPDQENYVPQAVVNPVEVERAVLESKLASEEAQKAPEEIKAVEPAPVVPQPAPEAPKPDVAPVAAALKALAVEKSMTKAPMAPAPAPVTKLVPASPDHAPGGKLAKPATKSVAEKPANKVAEIKSPRQKIRDLLDKKILNAGQAQAVVDIKKAAKKSWEALGVTSDEQKMIEKHLSK